MFAVMLTVLLSVSVVSDGQSVFVSNDGAEPVTYTIQIGEGFVAGVVLEPGEVREWTGDSVLNWWQVWDADMTLVAYGQLGSEFEPDVAPEDVPTVTVNPRPLTKTVAVSDSVRVFRGQQRIV